jgi:hypothetical protein
MSCGRPIVGQTSSSLAAAAQGPLAAGADERPAVGDPGKRSLIALNDERGTRPDGSNLIPRRRSSRAASKGFNPEASMMSSRSTRARDTQHSVGPSGLTIPLALWLSSHSSRHRRFLAAALGRLFMSPRRSLPGARGVGRPRLNPWSTRYSSVRSAANWAELRVR